MAKETKKTTKSDKTRGDAPSSEGASSPVSSKRRDRERLEKKKAAPPPEPEERDEDEDQDEDGEERDQEGEEPTASGIAEAADDESESEEESDGDESNASGSDSKAAREGEVDEDVDVPTAQLGIAKYVTAAFLGAALLGAFVFGKTVHGIWETASNKAWFARKVPALAAIPDETKSILSTLVGGLLAFVIVYRLYKKPDVRTWADEVASEMREVKWPSRADVQGSTIVVIAASAVAAIYLTVLDRLWSFVTNIVYGGGS